MIRVHRAKDRLNMITAFSVTRVKDPDAIIAAADREAHG